MSSLVGKEWHGTRALDGFDKTGNPLPVTRTDFSLKLSISFVELPKLFTVITVITVI